jgi:hypothetical protein
MPALGVHAGLCSPVESMSANHKLAECQSRPLRKAAKKVRNPGKYRSAEPALLLHAVMLSLDFRSPILPKMPQKHRPHACVMIRYGYGWDNQPRTLTHASLCPRTADAQLVRQPDSSQIARYELKASYTEPGLLSGKMKAPDNSCLYIRMLLAQAFSAEPGSEEGYMIWSGTGVSAGASAFDLGEFVL